MRNIQQYADSGRKRLESQPGYDLSVDECQKIFSLTDGDRFKMLCLALEVGIEIGIRMEQGRRK